MGAACCVAARDGTLPTRTSTEALHRNIRYSPSWSFRWDNRRRVAGEVGNSPSRYSHGNSGNTGSDVKDQIDVERDISDGGSSLENFRTPTWQKSTIHDGAIGNSTTPASVLVLALWSVRKYYDVVSLVCPEGYVREKWLEKGSFDDSSYTLFLRSRAMDSWLKEIYPWTAVSLLRQVRESLRSPSATDSSVKDSIELSPIAEPSAVAAEPSVPKFPFSVPSTSNMSMHRDVDPSTPSRWARRSPGHQLFRGISDSRILGLKSPNDNSVSEGRQSFVLSTCSNDMTLGSQCGSSDGWSMRTFSELVASSQRDRWSFDSEAMDSGRGKITRSNSQLFASPSNDLKTCGVCSKLLTERSSWSSQKIIANNELSVVGVLVCGHVYHAECLENMTPETERYDPSCPACMVGERQGLKMSGKQLKEAELKVRHNWISRNRVIDGDIDGKSVLSNQRKRAGTEGKGPKMGSSSSVKNSFVKPFLRRHFSLGSKSTRALSVNDLSARRKGFWARYH
ncbi:hypothetical protein IFM89_006599 [Coptis chinensis]|uniref:RING-type domain-containing protein n=1 Tax=Coptis chinensis TaxID=261450 RepID=A0A835INE0_9MAGN|nr:hypothetical protein IFM89_006599 [Coptis chinensis]